MLMMPDGTEVEQNGPEDKATWWTCWVCGFKGPAVGADKQGRHACMGIMCDGVELNPTSPKDAGYWAKEREQDA